MSKITQGSAAVELTEGIIFPEGAGTLTDKELQALFPARKGIGYTCTATADALTKYADRLNVPGISPEALEAAGRQADAINRHVTDVEVLLQKLKQADRLLDNQAHEMLRRVLASVRAAEKFDPAAPSLVPELIEYFGGRG